VLWIRLRLSQRSKDIIIDWNFLHDKKKPAPVKAKDEVLYIELWSDLRKLYNHYVKGKFLQENELELLVK